MVELGCRRPMGTVTVPVPQGIPRHGDMGTWGTGAWHSPCNPPYPGFPLRVGMEPQLWFWAVASSLERQLRRRLL